MVPLVLNPPVKRAGLVPVRLPVILGKLINKTLTTYSWHREHGSDNCTEATVLLNVYPVFVSKFYFDCESNIRPLIDRDQRAYYNAIQNVFAV